MYTAIWEVSNKNRDDFQENDIGHFNTIEEAKEWFDFRFNHPDYYCIVFNFCCSAVLTNKTGE